MTTATHQATPRIYVACLAAYNDGILHGRWLDATSDVDALHDQVAAILAASPVPGAEEFAIHDYEGFGDYAVNEYESLAAIAALAGLIEEHGAAITAFLSHTGEQPTHPDLSERFTDAYLGAWDSLEAYADEILDAVGALDGLPEHLRSYFNVEAYARDLELSGDVWTHRDEHGTVHVFANC